MNYEQQALELIEENEALKAQVNELKVYIGAALQQAFSKERDSILHEARRLTPNYCLNTIKADAIDDFWKYLIGECTGSDNGVDPVLDDYTNDNLMTPVKKYYCKNLRG